MTLYHGTTAEAAESIREEGFIDGPAFFTPRRDIAENYCADVVIAVDLDEDVLLKDFDTEDYDDGPMADWLAAGKSVYVKRDVEVVGAAFLVAEA